MRCFQREMGWREEDRKEMMPGRKWPKYPVVTEATREGITEVLFHGKGAGIPHRAQGRTMSAIIFSVMSGTWSFPYIRPLTLTPFLVSFAITPVLFVLLYWTSRLIDKHEFSVICLWSAVGPLTQLGIRWLYPFALSTIIESTNATSFYTVTQQHTASDLLTNFLSLAGSLPLHARANMPGKILFFYLLETVTQSTEVMGCLIILVSNLGGLLIYFLARQIFDNRLTALYSMILYLLLPMKIYFFPLLNTVTPVLMLLCLLLFIQYLNTKQSWYLLALGTSLYFMMLFEPLPFVTGLIFLALLAKYGHEGQLDRSQLLKILAYVPGGFFAIHFLIVGTLGFNVLDTLAFVYEGARAFNVEQNRTYWPWVIYNFKDFFLHAGVACSLLFAIALGSNLWKLVELWRCRTAQKNDVVSFVTRSDVLILFAFSCDLLVLDLLGVNRAETARLWIFLAVFLQLIVAQWCAARRRHFLFASILGFTVLQATIGMSRIGFVIP